MIFPLRVLGSSAAKMRSAGLAMAPIWVTTWFRISSRSSSEVEIPSKTLTNAATACPLISSARPTTAASATAG